MAVSLYIFSDVQNEEEITKKPTLVIWGCKARTTCSSHMSGNLKGQMQNPWAPKLSFEDFSSLPFFFPIVFFVLFCFFVCLLLFLWALLLLFFLCEIEPCCVIPRVKKGLCNQTLLVWTSLVLGFKGAYA